MLQLYSQKRLKRVSEIKRVDKSKNLDTTLSKRAESLESPQLCDAYFIKRRMISLYKANNMEVGRSFEGALEHPTCLVKETMWFFQEWSLRKKMLRTKENLSLFLCWRSEDRDSFTGFRKYLKQSHFLCPN